MTAKRKVSLSLDADLVDEFGKDATEGLSAQVTDRALARFVGAMLHTAGAGSEHIVDAHVVATAVEAGGGIVLTADTGDLTRLAAPYRSVLVEPLT